MGMGMGMELVHKKSAFKGLKIKPPDRVIQPTMAPKKTSSKASVSESTPAPVASSTPVPAPPAPVSAPVEESAVAPVPEKVKRPRVSKKVAEVESASASAPAPVSVPVEEVAEEVSATTHVPVNDAEILKADLLKQHQLVTQIAILFSEVKSLSKSLDKRAEKVIKNANKKSGKRTRIVNPDHPRKPAGFCRPVGISAELAEFLGRPATDTMPRTEVSKLVYQIIQNNQGEGRTDARTSQINKLLNKQDESPIRYCDLQTFLKAHFIALPESESATA